MSLDPIQVAVLLRPIKPHRVLVLRGNSHLPTFDVIAHLNRVFGFDGWDKEILDLAVVHEREDKNRWWVTYRCSLRLTVRDPGGNVVAVREDAATGSSQNQPSPGDAHDMAIKAAVSYALKRCAKDWGDQFGLSLYNKGQTAALVGATCVRSDGTIDLEAARTLDDAAPKAESMGNDEHQWSDDDPERPYADAVTPLD